MGRHALQLWLPDDGSDLRLAHAATVSASPAATTPAFDASLLQAVLSKAGATAASSLHVLVESSGMPASLVAMGRRFWTAEQTVAMGRHRFVDLFGDPALNWQLRTSYLAGDEVALFYGADPRLCEGIRQASSATVRGLDSLQPAFAWGWQRWKAKSARNYSGWFVWQEQDRSLIALVDRGRLADFNPCGPVASEAGEWHDVLAVEAARHGVADELPVTLAHVGGATLHLPEGVAA